MPSGTITFLFTDIEGSTRRWERDTETMRTDVARHDELVEEAVERHHGLVFATAGDGFAVAFARAGDALSCAVDVQNSLRGAGLPGVRMGVHTGEAEERAGNYFGPSVNRAARLMAIGHGGQILVSNATEQLSRDSLGAGMTLIDLGEHRLRDLSRPERVFELAGPGLEHEFAPLRSLGAFAANLPVQVTSFVGRTTEMLSIASALGEARLVTITGVGGVGKTRLAVHLAAEMLPRFRDGAWLCELAAAEDAETMSQVVGSTLGVIPRPEMSFVESIVDFLRVKQMLVVMDNCEHLLEPVTRLIDDVLRGCREIRFLATSREVLSVPGERVVGLRSLSLPDASSTPDRILVSEAAELFVERAQATRSTFEINATNAAAIAEICRRLDGIPLALELAAARVGAMTPIEIASHLDERFRLLRGGRRAAVERHHTLRATVDWSYSLLSMSERTVFERLTVFAGGFDARDACAVVIGSGIEQWDVLDALASLVAKSMLIADEDEDAVTRYQMLETIGAYGRERLDAIGESDVWRRRHAERYTEFAIEVRNALVGPDELAWRRRLRAEHDNVRAAMFWSLDSNTRGDRRFALAIMANLASQVQADRASGHGAWASRALPFVHEATPGERAAVLACAAFDAYHRGDLDAACTLAQEAVRPAVPDDCPFPSLPFVALAAAIVQTGRRDDAEAVLTTALEQEDAIRRDPYSEAILLGVRSILRSFNENTDSARDDADNSLRRARALGNPLLLVVVLTAVAHAWLDEDPARARAALEECIALTRAGASDVNLSPALKDLARLRMRDGDGTGALDALRDALIHDHASGNRPGMAGTLILGSELLTALGYRHEAVVLTCAAIDGELSPVTSSDVATSLRGILSQERQALGEQAYKAAAAKGSTFSYEEAVAYALDAIETARAELEHARAGPTTQYQRSADLSP
jgi:predicted ATPase/class 3 adenylate cyclase